MFGSEFYHASLRRYVVIFGTMFNDIVISRANNAGQTQQRMTVPIAYGPMQKFLARVESDPNLDRPHAISLPRMSFEITGLQYDGQRRLSTLSTNRKSLAANNSSFDDQFVPAPYDIDFTLTVMTKYAEDATKIVEQIVPYFKPDWTTTVKIIDEMDAYVDIPTILTGVSTEEVYEGQFDERRAVIWTLTFTMKAYFFGPKKTKKVIKFANVAMFTNMTNNTASHYVRVQPGVNSSNVAADYLSSQVVQATATSVLDGNGSVSSITVTNEGLGYTSATVTIEDPSGNGQGPGPGPGPGGSVTATATANVVDDRVRSIEITNGGTGYSTPPVVTISAPDNVSVDVSEINFGDDWDYIVTVEET